MNKISVLLPEKIGKINPDIYGHFSEHIGGVIYNGVWVGENSTIPNINGIRKDLIEMLRVIKPPVLRWPGGCFAETYSWRDGIGAREKRPTTVNWWYNCDGKLESNEFGTHEFIEFCRLIGAKPYFAANATTLTPLEIRNWIEYCNFGKGTTALAKLREENGSAEPFNVEFWGLGNENWGGGGNMTPEDYCAAYRKYAMIAESAGKDCKFFACGANGSDLNWTRKFFEKFYDPRNVVNSKLDGYSIHYYCGTAGEAASFNEDEWYALLKQANLMSDIITQHRAVMDSYDPQRKTGIIVDEWGCWHKGGSGPSKGTNLFEQQITVRDALVSALTLNIFNNNCEKVIMANAAQLINNLHTLFLSENEKLIATPNYHVFNMMKEHQSAQCVKTIVETSKNGEVEEISASVSVKDGKTLYTIVNTNYNKSAEVEIKLYGGAFVGEAEITTLTAQPEACNTFETQENVVPSTKKTVLKGDSVTLTLPAASVTCIWC